MGDDASLACFITEQVAGRAAEWDISGELPRDLIRALGERGLLCAEVPQPIGGLGFSSLASGRLTAHVGALCSSLRSLMTSQAIAAGIICRFGSPQQQTRFLQRLVRGDTAGVAFSEAGAGSDLSGIQTEVVRDGERLLLDGAKVWVTGAHYAQWIVVFARHAGGAAFVVVPTEASGVQRERVANPLGCRAAGHAHVRFERVQLPLDHLLGGAGLPLSFLATSALTHGRLSVAWGCLGILRACLLNTTEHVRQRTAFAKLLAEHQLVQLHLANLFTAEQLVTLACERASELWDCKSPDHVAAALLAKYVAARQAVEGSRTALQVLASAATTDGHPLARSYRDAKLMEIIEGSNEICQLLLAEKALGASA